MNPYEPPADRPIKSSERMAHSGRMFVLFVALSMTFCPVAVVTPSGGDVREALVVGVILAVASIFFYLVGRGHAKALEQVKQLERLKDFISETTE